MKRGLALFLAALLTALTLTACGGSDGGGSSSGDSAASESQTAYDTGGGDNWKAAVQEFGFDTPADAAEAEGPSAPAEGGEEPQEDRLANAKMVYTASVDAETMDFDACAAGVEAAVEEMGGYLEYASASSYSDGLRAGSYTARIPAARFQDFLKRVGELTHVVDQNKSADNISERYYDTESRLATQRTKLERLQTLLAQAENMEDIITLESAIAETELEVEQLTGTLRHYDALVDYATVEIRLREVPRLTTVEEAPPTFASRLGNAFTDGLHGFGDFLQGLAIFLAYNWTWIVLLVLIALLVIRTSRKKQAERARTFQQERERNTGFFHRGEKDRGKNSDDKQEKG